METKVTNFQIPNLKKDKDTSLKEDLKRDVATTTLTLNKTASYIISIRILQNKNSASI